MSYDLLKNERLPGESYKEYKERRKLVNKLIKIYLRGRNAELGKESTEESSEVQGIVDTGTEGSEGEDTESQD